MVSVINKESYIVSFLPGTSGKFVTSMIWRMLVGGDEITFNSLNAAHDMAPWENTFYIPDEDCNSKDIYNKITFTTEIGLALTHTYPKFDELRKLETTKLILITLDKEDYKEVAYNWVSKNNSEDHFVMRIHRGLLYFSETNDPDVDTMQMHNFCNPVIPDDLLERTLLINYSDIYEPTKNSYVALEKLSKFLNCEVSEAVLKNYSVYVNNRNESIRWKLQKNINT